MKIPREVEIKKIGEEIYVGGRKGNQKAKVEGVEIEGGQIKVGSKVGEEVIKKMIKGVEKGYKVKLKIKGVGYKAKVENGEVKLSVGYKDEKVVKLPEKVEVKVEGNQIIGESTMKEELAQSMRKIEEVRAARKDKYKGKGIKERGRN